MPDDEINLHQLLGVLRESRWTLFFSLVIGLMCSRAFIFLTTPIYEADALVQVESENRSTLNKALGELADLAGDKTPMAAEIEIIKSRMVIGKVIDDLDLEVIARPHHFPIFGAAVARYYGDLAGPASPLFGLETYAWGGEHIAIGSLELPSAMLGRRLLLMATQAGYKLIDENQHELAEGKVGVPLVFKTRYGSASIFVRELRARTNTQFLVVRLPRSAAIGTLKNKLSVMERGKQSGMINVSYSDPDPQKVTNVVNSLVSAYQRQNLERRSVEAEQTLEFLNQQLPELKKKVEASESALNKFRLQNGSADLTKETELVLQQSVELETQRVGLMQKREEVLRRFTASHPVVQALDGQMRQINSEQNGVAVRVKGLPETQQELLSLARDMEVNNHLYTELLNSSQQLQVAKAGTVGNVRIIDRAVLPLNSSKPRKSVIMAMGTTLGLFLGLLLVYFRQAYRDGVSDPKLIENHLGLPTYAAIPYAKEQRQLTKLIGRDSKDGTQKILAVSDPSTLAIEAMRSLRTSLHFALMESSSNVVMLTGPTPSIGKSFITINLGAVLAMSGKRVVVVDADLRRGYLHKYVSADRASGLSDFIVGTKDVPDIIKTTPLNGLFLVSTGDLPPNPSELLLHERFPQLIRTLSQQYDYVLLDTPPVFAVTDAAVIGQVASCALLVLKAGKHPMRAIEECVRRLRQGGISLKGTLFNQVESGSGRYSLGYEYQYEYKRLKQ